jgi:hypothetical protein
MEFLAGTVLVVIGLFMIPLGRPNAVRSRDEAARSFALPAWIDRAVNWAMGLLCVWFGLALLFGRVRF